MGKKFSKVRRYGTFILLLTSILVLTLFGLFQEDYFLKFIDIVSKYIWPAMIAVLTLFGIVVGGVIKNPPKSFTQFLDNGLLQIAVLEFFFFIVGLTWYTYSEQQPGEIVLKLTSETTSPQIKVSMIFGEDSTNAREILVPDTLHNKRPGKYTFKIIDPKYYESGKEIELEPNEMQIVLLEDRKITCTLIVNSEPTGAEIWINDSRQEERTTPDRLDQLDCCTLSLVLELAGYKSETLSVSLASQSKFDTGIIPLRKLYRIEFVCKYQDLKFTINGQPYIGDQEEVWLPEGRNDITIEIGNPPFRPRNLNITRSRIFAIPGSL